MEQAEHEPDLKETLALLRRQSGVIGLVTAALVGLVTLWLLSVTPEYQATALVLVDPTQKDLLDPNRPAASAQGESARIDSEVEILRADATLLAVIAREGVTPAAFAGPPRLRDRLWPARGAAAGSVLRQLRERVTVRRRGLTHVIAVSVRTTDPVQAAALADALVEVYVARQIAAKAGVAEAARDTLLAQIDAAATAVEEAEAALGQHRTQGARPSLALEQGLAVARHHYMVHLERLRDFEAQAALQVADSRLVSAAVVPDHPVFPSKRMILSVTLILGLGLGVALAFLREFHVGGVTSQRQLRNLLHQPVLAAVPPEGSRAAADAMLLRPLSPFAEAVRKVQAGLDRSAPQVILLASALPGEGKSTLALALARGFERAGRRVLLVDSDLRRPGLHHLAGLVPEMGLLDYLREPERSGPAVCVRDPLSGAEVIPGVAAAEEPTDTLLASEAFARLIAEAREAFDVILLDSPPVLPVVDARLLAPHADAILLVVRAGHAAQAEIRQAAEQLAEDARPGARFAALLNLSEEGVRAYRSARYQRPGRLGRPRSRDVPAE